jgi:hypothetical protein
MNAVQEQIVLLRPSLRNVAANRPEFMSPLSKDGTLLCG